jgi:hypothetical protein
VRIRVLPASFHVQHSRRPQLVVLLQRKTRNTSLRDRE